VAKIRVCSVVYTEVADCLTVANTALPPGLAPEEKVSLRGNEPKQETIGEMLAQPLVSRITGD